MVDKSAGSVSIRFKSGSYLRAEIFLPFFYACFPDWYGLLINMRVK
ncbi:hypothetical protein FB99_27510 [Pantoea agglomerans]|nr:hypothetical protein FB99_27510 [Pantoea agglomerans]